MRDVTNYIVDVVMRPTFGHSSIVLKKVIINSILSRFPQKKGFS